MKNRLKTQKGRKREFVRKTVTLPKDLEAYTEERADAPEHAGNLSSYIRNLILNDRKTRQSAAA